MPRSPTRRPGGLSIHPCKTDSKEPDTVHGFKDAIEAAVRPAIAPAPALVRCRGAAARARVVLAEVASDVMGAG